MLLRIDNGHGGLLDCLHRQCRTGALRPNDGGRGDEHFFHLRNLLDNVPFDDTLIDRDCTFESQLAEKGLKAVNVQLK